MVRVENVTQSLFMTKSLPSSYTAMSIGVLFQHLGVRFERKHVLFHECLGYVFNIETIGSPESTNGAYAEVEGLLDLWEEANVIFPRLPGCLP